MEKIIIGRSVPDLRKFKDEGTAFIGRHIVGKGEEAHLTNPVHMDVVRPHVLLICGKRGSGKSYSGGIIAEEITRIPEEIRQNLSVLMVDTMGIYWSMKSPNEKDRKLLKEWGLEPNGIETRFICPRGYIKSYEDVGIEVDVPLTLACGEITAQDWATTFGFNLMDQNGVLVERAIKSVQSKMGDRYSIDEIIREVEADPRSEQKTKNAVINRFLSAKDWGIFEKDGTQIKDMFVRGGISVLDVSHYSRSSGGWSVRGMVVGIFARKIFHERLMARKAEEFEVMSGEKKDTIPLVWIMSDEAHQFLPSQGDSVALEPMLTLIKEGREPGVSLLLITQMPNKLHPEALAQSDIVISHRLTAESDINALQSIMQSYMLDDIKTLINNLPRQVGSAVILDDNSERVFSAQIRPRFSWHAGGSPAAIKERGILD